MNVLISLNFAVKFSSTGVIYLFINNRAKHIELNE